MATERTSDQKLAGEYSFTLDLDGDCSIKNAQAVAELLRGALTAHPSIGVSTQGMTGADLSTAQSLLAARAQAQAQGKTLALLHPLGTALSAFVDAAGLTGSLQPRSDAAFWAGHRLSGA